VTAIFAIGVIGVLIPGLQPQLLGALAAEGRLSAQALGILAAAELLVMGLSAGLAGAFLSVDRLRPIAVAALVTTAAADLVSPFADAGALFAARAVAGLGEGVAIWIAIGFIVRTERPDRWSGVYLAVQTLAQLALASLIAYFAATSTGGFFALGGVTLAGLLAVAWMPRSFAPLTNDGGRGGLPSARGLIALAGVLVYLGYVVAVWVYLEPLANELGIPPSIVHLIAPVSLAMQVLGAGLATYVSGRLPARATILAVGAINLGILAILRAPPSPAAFLVATSLFGFLWLFVLPFQIPLVIAADGSRRAALLIGGAQLTGSSLGPLAAGVLIGDRDVSHVIGFALVCVIAGIAALVAASGRLRGWGAL